MDDSLTATGAAAFGTTGIAYLGILLFVLLGLYAGLLLNARRLPAWMRLPMPSRLRPRLTVALVLVATLPAVSLALVLSDRASRQRTDRAAAALRNDAEGVARSLDYLLGKTASGVSALAEHIERAGAHTRDELGRQLERHHQTEPAIESMAVVGLDGAVLAATLRDGDRVLPFDGAPSADGARELAALARQPARAQVTGAAVEPLRGRAPAVLISAPLRGPDGAARGAVVGAFDPRSVSALEGWVGDDLPGGLVVADGRMRVVFATASSGIAPGQDLRGSALGANPAGRPFAFSLQPGAGSRQEFIGVSTRLGNGWRAVRFVPLASVQAARRQEVGVAMGWLLAALLVSVCLAVALAGSISGPLSALDAAVRRFDPEGDGTAAKPPADAPREVTVVFEHLATVGEHLRRSYAQLNESLLRGERLRSELIQVIDSREQDIRSRTEELKEANSALERLSRVDALTGVANRRWLTEFLDKAWRAALRDQSPVAIVMIDIDHFKAYNDAYGHQQGDTCLQAVAEAIRHVIGRATDLVARYGGEEFVVVLGNTPLEGALRVGEQIRAAVERLAIPHRAAPGLKLVTVSAGVTSTQPSRGSKPETSLVAADRALYAAKEQGRNQVGFSSASRTGLLQSLCLPNEPAGKPS